MSVRFRQQLQIERDYIAENVQNGTFPLRNIGKNRYLCWAYNNGKKLAIYCTRCSKVISKKPGGVYLAHMRECETFDDYSNPMPTLKSMTRHEEVEYDQSHLYRVINTALKPMTPVKPIVPKLDYSYGDSPNDQKSRLINNPLNHLASGVSKFDYSHHDSITEGSTSESPQPHHVLQLSPIGL